MFDASVWEILRNLDLQDTVNMETKDVDAIFTSKTEKTFQFDEQLPSLPVPTLQHTLDRYLDSVKPHVSDDEYRQTEFIVQQFASGVGKELHRKLLDKARTEKNWLEKWWIDYAYLDYRLPIGPMINFSGPLPTIYHYYKIEYETQVERAAMLCHYYFKYWKYLRLEQIRPDKDSKGNRLSMNQFRRLFNTCRIPAPQRDHLKTYFQTESEGPMPLHLTVFCRGRIFITKCLDENEVPLTPPELQQQFQYITDKCANEPEGPGLGALTGDNRTTWAQIRSRLVALHPQNFTNLEIIQQSIMCVVFDDNCPANETEVFQLGLAGDSTNRWFDKSLTMIFFKNGLAASNCDHSPMDAMTLVTTTYYVDQCVLKCKGKWQGTKEVRQLETPRELVFKLDDVIERGIVQAKRVYNEIANNLQSHVVNYNKYGKKFLRQFKLHPDTHVQMMLQYAFYKLYKKPAPTYQTGTTRKYYNARTETVRSCSPEAIEWAKAMLNPDINNRTKVALYRQAADKHNKLMAEATENQGCDRHLFGLQILAVEGGLPMPQIFTDPAYTKSGSGGNFVLSTSFVGYTPVYGGVVPMVEHGYGTFYKIEQDCISMFVSAWKSCSQTNAVEFGNMIQECLNETGALLAETEKLARL
ncbi:peroxisomal carnitine O-octanoyltransferase-like isoform X2 [Ruditapes philippinarum]|uniref:peroxisomal carnitine O-octanoyltransferase-like isoform X2 n=2 Tax=Ruditapes philippinarum TaxID=129788 RepID=UPI00295BA8BC|nr:peroxisomal carnitine O-octanoyltransferase-like isoform X2 [Ruditapes philippinarum]